MHRTAIVVGGSVAGFLAARALADHCSRVVLLERDRLSASDGPRKGVPQALHTHAMLHGGAEVIRRFIPDFPIDPELSGLYTADAARDIRWFHFGVWKGRSETQTHVHFCVRSKLEEALREHILKLPNVELLAERNVIGLRGGDRVTGVRLAESSGELKADLVVDASGRGSQATAWLEELGHARPNRIEIRVDVAYASRLYEVPSDFEPDWIALSHYPKPPLNRRMGNLSRYGTKHLMLSLGGWCGDHCPTDEEGFLEFARSLPQPEIFETVRHLKAATPIRTIRFPSNIWRRFDRMRSWPDGFVVIGDAVCSFNPIYGQGMSVAALCAEAMQRECGGSEQGLAQRIQKHFAGIIRTPWLLATSEDFRFPAVRGRRPFGTTAINWFSGRVLELLGEDDELHRRWVEVMTLRRGLSRLLHPHILRRVLGI